ncbi:Hypothetical predicted protein [Mytilus galloprovincialis]|uniref:Uncharacterized protein n=1 Tax=Mytilus galloprovincialis TaxID=29158 RepID=A0A8B6F083_MYTGA|nr:Hypothetical predicted protein [Mytilus galloprovincialis]
MMDHFDEIAAIALAERLGGEDGYCLLLSAVKNSLPLAFLNGASSYAAYCVNLLYNHFVSGPFYQNMKCSLFTTPHKGSIVNIALDAKREMDDKDVIKSFRSGSTMSSILPRMSLIDTLNQASNCSKRSLVMSDAGQDDQKVDERKILGISLNKTDAYCRCREIFNTKVPLYKWTVSMYKNDTPSMQDLTGPKQLLQKVKSSKGVTIKRITSANTQTAKSEKERIEQKRRTAVKRETKKIDCISSEMNACQAILKPDCSKPKVLKSTGIQKAIIQLTAKSLCMLDGHLQEEIQDNGIIKIAENVLPDSIRSEVKLATVEFAGVKFKAKVFSGDDYLDFVKNYAIQKTINQMPNISRMVICEEKYHFTPDDFKTATRAQRTSSSNVGISHLKTVDEMISANRFDKASLVSTAEGKSFISTYLARRIDELHLYMDLTLIIDSEYYKEDGYTTPIQCLLGKKEGLKSKTQMVNIKQRKGEAEMAQLEWLLEFADKLEQGDGCASIVTSGDIDAVKSLKKLGEKNILPQK